MVASVPLMRGLLLFAIFLLPVLPAAGAGAAEREGARIIFSAALVWERGAYDTQIYSVLPSGRGLAQLTSGSTPASSPLPSPDGRLILFARSDELWVMNPDGRHQRRLVAHGSDPAWTPDSRRIAFVAGGHIRTIGTDGRRSRLIVRNARLPAWSPDGSSLAFARDDPGQGVDVLVRRKGRERLLDVIARVDRMAWSPDGGWIAFSCCGPVPGSILKIIRPDGSHLRYFWRAWEPAWSPDARMLAFIEAGALQVLNMETGARRTLGSRPSSYYMRSLAWSPAGDEIAYTFGPDLDEPYGGIESVSLAGRVRRIPAAREVGHGLAWSTASSGLRYRAPLPLGLVVGDELRHRTPIEELAVDRDWVAYRSCGAMSVWLRGRTSIEPIRLESPLCAWHGPISIGGIALAGDHVAWGVLAGGNVKSGWLSVAVVGDSAPETVVSAPRAQTGGDPRGNARSGYLRGDGPLLVFSTWAYCDDLGQPCPEVPIADRPLVSQTIWRVREASWPGTCPLESPTARTRSAIPGHCQSLSSEPGLFVPFDVDAGRIAAVGDNAVVVLDENGNRLLDVPVRALAAQLSGSDLIVLVQGSLRVYSADTGALVATWPLPDVPSGGICRAKPCGSARLRLEDAARGLIAYLLDGKLHLLRLRDGTDAVVADATAARFGDNGLFYAYEAPYPWRGRIRFVPFERLPLH